MNLERVAHRRLPDAGRADGDDAVDHLFLALLAAVSWLLALRRRAGDFAVLWLLSLEARQTLPQEWL